MTEHDEKWLLSKGWEKIDGWKVDASALADFDEDVFFRDLEDFAQKAIYYQNEEFASDDLDQCIEMQEEYDEPV